jgi:hypothetical protein
LYRRSNATMCPLPEARSSLKLLRVSMSIAIFLKATLLTPIQKGNPASSPSATTSVVFCYWWFGRRLGDSVWLPRKNLYIIK